MAYSDVDIEFKKTRAPGDLVGRIEVALLQQAVTRITAVATSDPDRERLIIASVFQGLIPDSWRIMVLRLLDIAGQLPANPTTNNPTDAQVNTQVVTAWGHVVNARRLVS